MSAQKVTNQTEESEETSVEIKDEVDTNVESDTVEIEEEIKEPSAEEKYQELNDRYLRLYSEFENFRRRTAKEKLELISSAGGQVLGDLLPIIDDFERAIVNNVEVDDPKTIKEGIQLIHSKMENIFKNKGLKEIDALNETFDLDFHEAITKIPAPTEDLKGKVVDVVEKGYMLNEKVLRYSKVIVGE
ncbi:MAG: nucleotide exchange factor GrpE [Salibacteraceae bacterium]|nr:nucleotide exchange factor GrpE [Salibacteraceae bacterium]|tara:strand:- start:48966 stop:49529 length:564 start_codon:yes stop_codon:yes gene_type:complete